MNEKLLAYGAIIGAIIIMSTIVFPFWNLIPTMVTDVTTKALIRDDAETLVMWAGYSNYSDGVAFVILIVVLLVRPGGLLGSSKVEKV